LLVFLVESDYVFSVMHYAFQITD